LDQSDCAFLGSLLHQDFDLLIGLAGQEHQAIAPDFWHGHRSYGRQHARSMHSTFGRMQTSFRLLESEHWTLSGTDFPHLFYLDTSWYVLSGMAQKIMSLTVLLAVSVFTDLICSVLPFPILWSVQLSRRKKTAVGVLMALGAMWVYLMG
jgi:hypothetical protein